jgi:hypothetical protein
MFRYSRLVLRGLVLIPTSLTATYGIFVALDLADHCVNCVIHFFVALWLYALHFLLFLLSWSSWSNLPPFQWSWGEYREILRAHSVEHFTNIWNLGQAVTQNRVSAIVVIMWPLLLIVSYIIEGYRVGWVEALRTIFRDSFFVTRLMYRGIRYVPESTRILASRIQKIITNRDLRASLKRATNEARQLND